MTTLHRLAEEAGLHRDWQDATGRPERVADETLRNVLSALGFPAGSEDEIEDSRRRLRELGEAIPSLITADVGEPVRLPPALASSGRATLRLENGGSRDLDLADQLRIDEAGYHVLEAGERQITLAVAPRRCFMPADAVPGRKPWGASVQIPSLRDERGEPFGDFGSLARLAAALGRRGADALAVSPVHALFPADSSRFSPYAPSSRLYVHAMLADPTLVDAGSPADDAGELIDWSAAIPARLARLRTAFNNRSDRTRDAVAAFAAAEGEPLELHARYDALFTRFFPGSSGWQGWPAEYQDPRGPAAERFATEHREEVDFYIFLQWLADESLRRAQQSALHSGMRIGLIADLAVGMDSGGSHAWSRPNQLLTGLSVGAPPDLLGPDGQDWGITGFSPYGLVQSGFQDFIATLRTAMRHAGGVRIDHAMSLRRLWLIPHGSSAQEGAYISYPEEDMMRLLALESSRARAIVIGEDLGTVPGGFRETLAERGILGMRVLWFERTQGGGFKPPAQWAPGAAAMTTTHDLPTVAGWWGGGDIDWTWRIGRTTGHADRAAEEANRDEDRERLWQACRDAGVADGDRPSSDNPSPAIDAAIAYVDAAPCDLTIIPLEDLVGEAEQPNLPGTTDQHPNWRRRLAKPVETMFDEPAVARRLETLTEQRR